MPKIHANILKLYIITAIKWFMLFIPIMVLYFQEKGLSMTEIITLQALFSLVIILTEVPSGYFADKVGRKQSIILSTILGAIGTILYTQANHFTGFLIAETFLGFSASFISGADTALLYDSHLEENTQSDFKNTQSKLTAISSFSEGTASIIGGFLALISLKTPLIAEAAILLIAIPIAFSLREPKIKKFKLPENKITQILKLKNQKIIWLMVYSGVIGAATFNIVWFIQPFLQSVGLPLALFGITWALLQFTISGASLLSNKIEQKFGKEKTFVSLIVLIGLAYTLLSVFDNIYAIAIFFIFYIVRGIREPLMKTYLNELIPSEIRATILSVQSLITRFFFVILGPIFGYITDTYSMSQALLIAGITFSALGIFSLTMMKKNKIL